MSPSRLLGAVTIIVAALVVAPRATAEAVPIFGHRYALSCQACHPTVPLLNDFGEKFEANGFRLPGVAEHVAFPVAVKTKLAYTSEPDPTGLPKATVDEIELLLGGSAGKRLSYFVEQYVVDGGRHGSLRDAWLRYDAGTFALRAGQFTLPLPVDPESFRPTERHYAVFDQTAGANPFNFFEAKAGVEAIAGANDGPQFHLAALQAHDKQSGLPSRGVDVMASAQAPVGPLMLSAYRYVGSRTLGPQPDAFWRQGYALGSEFGKLAWTGLLQTGGDSSADGAGRSVRSSGGFLETRWAYSPALQTIVRYDGTNDPSGLQRSTTVSLVRRTSSNSRLTLEDVLTTGKQTLNVTMMFAY
ncbi:MAG: hypothetical protein GIW95_03140 [Candidatus Eremiobacteraeota bacterium]|nr:hypothetical protein [Candidatus Eremiobacteraeota bacterium]